MGDLVQLAAIEVGMSVQNVRTCLQEMSQCVGRPACPHPLLATAPWPASQLTHFQGHLPTQGRWASSIWTAIGKAVGSFRNSEREEERPCCAVRRQIQG
jgi:hypothetical protein